MLQLPPHLAGVLAAARRVRVVMGSTVAGVLAAAALHRVQERSRHERAASRHWRGSDARATCWAPAACCQLLPQQKRG